ncbi:MAG: enoyl-CoA hydratase, partial [Candidatus Taylorbacteria bacterium]|nr:enoyl-CoA hydratase [Candidatus Taylorbacteria bacterium]
MNPKNLSINDVNIGDSAAFEQIWSEKDVDDFAHLSGNYNPLHTNEDYAKSTKFKKRIIYGMQEAISFSTLVGMYLPGKRSL